MRATWTSSIRPVLPTPPGAGGSQREFKLDGNASLAISCMKLRETVDLGKECRWSARAFLDRPGEHAGVLLGGKVDGGVQLQRTARIGQFRRCVGIGGDRAVGHMKNISAQVRSVRNLRRGELRHADVAHGRYQGRGAAREQPFEVGEFKT